MLNTEELRQRIESGTLLEVTNEGIELKEQWGRPHGKALSAMANSEDGLIRFIIVGVNDRGSLAGQDEAWLKDTEHTISNQVNSLLSPTSAIKSISGHKAQGGCYIIIQLKNPGDVTEWDRVAYKRVGTTSVEMTPEDKLDLSLKLPGQDYSRQDWHGETAPSLLIEFAKKLKEKGHTGIPENLSSLSGNEILNRINCFGKMAAKILFGDCPVRVAYYNSEGDVINQIEKKGAFYLLSDEFIEHVLVWTKTKGTVLQGHSISAVNEEVYPLKALREALANAVAHSLYERSNGEIIVELYPDRMVIRNNCPADVSQLAKEWFSKKTHSRNKFLMTLLREAGFSDELGSGKIRLFSQMLEKGKREPLIEFYEKGSFGCWAVTLYNEEENQQHVTLLERFKSYFSSLDEARIAMALVLWRNKSWTEIQEKLDWTVPLKLES